MHKNTNLSIKSTIKNFVFTFVSVHQVAKQFSLSVQQGFDLLEVIGRVMIDPRTAVFSCSINTTSQVKLKVDYVDCWAL